MAVVISHGHIKLLSFVGDLNQIQNVAVLVLSEVKLQLNSGGVALRREGQIQIPLDGSLIGSHQEGSQHAILILLDSLLGDVVVLGHFLVVNGNALHASSLRNQVTDFILLTNLNLGRLGGGELLIGKRLKNNYRYSTFGCIELF